MNTQYRKNLKAVLEASKTYCDESIESLKWELGTYDLGVETVNGTTSLLPTPANTIQASMVRIDGASEVSENLIVLQDVAETTINGITYSVKDGVITLNGTATQNTKFSFEFVNAIPKNKDYYVLLFISGTTTATNPKAIGETNNDERLLIPPTTTFNVNYDIKYFWFTAVNGTVWTNYAIKPMLVKGSTIPTVWKQGFEGIHNLELSWLVVKNSDDEVIQTLPIDLSTILYNGNPLFEGNSLKGVGTAKDYITPYVAHKEVGTRAYQSGDEEDSDVLTDGTTTLYPLATPIEVSIDFSQLVNFEAHSNGSITLVNTNNQDTTSTFKYLKEVAK